MIRRLAIIGVGLIGGSLARALRGARAVDEVVGCGRSLSNLDRAVAIGVIDRFSQDPAAAVEGADLVFHQASAAPGVGGSADITADDGFDDHRSSSGANGAGSGTAGARIIQRFP